ncbi:MAG: DsrE family protein [Deltaproteobacteria bacterium]|nr:DsrE family protein [Deltaproteobacteria bacterium]
MKVLVIVNDAPYGSERVFNALRLADVLLQVEEDLELTVFLLGDAVLGAKAGQSTPPGYYNVARMLTPIIRRGMVLCCETCMAARGLKVEELVEGCRRARLGELGTLTLDADKVLTF